MGARMKAISISWIKSWKLSLKKLVLKLEIQQVQRMPGIILIERRNNLIILRFNWRVERVEALEELQQAIMLQAKEEVGHKGALKEWKIFQELVPA